MGPCELCFLVIGRNSFWGAPLRPQPLCDCSALTGTLRGASYQACDLFCEFLSPSLQESSSRSHHFAEGVGSRGPYRPGKGGSPGVLTKNAITQGSRM